MTVVIGIAGWVIVACSRSLNLMLLLWDRRWRLRYTCKLLEAGKITAKDVAALMESTNGTRSEPPDVPRSSPP